MKPASAASLVIVMVCTDHHASRYCMTVSDCRRDRNSARYVASLSVLSCMRTTSMVYTCYRDMCDLFRPTASSPRIAICLESSIGCDIYEYHRWAICSIVAVRKYTILGVQQKHRSTSFKLMTARISHSIQMPKDQILLCVEPMRFLTRWLRTGAN